MTRQALAMRPNLDEEAMALIARTIAPGITALEAQLVGQIARRRGLDPFAGQLAVFKDSRGRLVVAVTIGGLRAQAERSGAYRGQIGPEWRSRDGDWSDVWLEDDPPFAARVGVLRAGFERPMWGTARFSSFARRNRDGQLIGLWATAPEWMIGVRAEAAALRRAFPDAVGGLELAIDDGEIVEGPPAITNPESPASPSQLGKLHELARVRGWSDEERHYRAGVQSFRELSKGQAGELIGDWSTLEDPDDERRAPSTGRTAEAAGACGLGDAHPQPSSRVAPALAVSAAPGGDTAIAPPRAVRSEDTPSQTSPALATPEMWARAIEHFGSRGAALRAVIESFRPGDGASTTDVTEAELRELLP